MTRMLIVLCTLQTMIGLSSAQAEGPTVITLSCDGTTKAYVKSEESINLAERTVWAPPSPDHGHMFALSDSQLRTIWSAADGLPAKERGVYLERMIAWLQFRGGRFIDRDLDDAVARQPIDLNQIAKFCNLFSCCAWGGSA
jgi:hypothetical protein